MRRLLRLGQNAGIFYLGAKPGHKWYSPSSGCKFDLIPPLQDPHHAVTGSFRPEEFCYDFGALKSKMPFHARLLCHEVTFNATCLTLNPQARYAHRMDLRCREVYKVRTPPLPSRARTVHSVATSMNGAFSMTREPIFSDALRLLPVKLFSFLQFDGGTLDLKTCPHFDHFSNFLATIARQQLRITYTLQRSKLSSRRASFTCLLYQTSGLTSRKVLKHLSRKKVFENFLGRQLANLHGMNISL